MVDCKITVLGPHWTENPGWVSASGDFSECKIYDIQVKNWEQHKGFGSALLSYLIEILKAEECSRIVGELISDDLERQPWLPEFYLKNGFQVEVDRAGYIFKNLLGLACEKDFSGTFARPEKRGQAIRHPLRPDNYKP